MADLCFLDEARHVVIDRVAARAWMFTKVLPVCCRAKPSLLLRYQNFTTSMKAT